RSASDDAAPLVDDIFDPKAARPTASSLSSTAISAGAADEASEMTFLRLRQTASAGRRAPTSLVIALTPLVASPCTEAPQSAKPSRKSQFTAVQFASGCSIAGLVSGCKFASALAISAADVNRSAGMSHLSRGAAREACSGLLRRRTAAIAD